MAESAPAAEDIQRQMHTVRSELREDVQEIVDNARVLGQWQYYVRNYPWLCLGAAAAAGYLLVPPRMHVIRPDADDLAKLVRQHQIALKTEVKPQPAPSLLGRLVGMAAGALLQGAVAVASGQMNQLMRRLATVPPPPLETGGGFSHEKPHR